MAKKKNGNGRNGKNGLTQKQKQFVREYLIDLNATQAAIRAGYSPKTAHAIGPENLDKPGIQEAIARLVKDRAKRIEVTSDRVLEELARVGFSNILNVGSWEGNRIALRDSDKLSEAAAAAISEVSEAKDGHLRFKMHDKIRALLRLADHVGMTDKTPDTGDTELGGEYLVTIKRDDRPKGE